MARSVATIDSPEFINLTPFNPLISKCEIKVLYVGENRNRSFISKTVAAEMANSLPGCPIVGYYREENEDFSDHGQEVSIDGEGVTFKNKTKPYGFVGAEAPVWFQTFEDTDDMGQMVVREYLMTTGYLWTGQYEEAQRVIDCGNNQSMELDEKSLQGKWATNNKTGVEFFIINDAIFSKLAILGENVEPCFEGAEITSPRVSSSFSLDDEFKTTLFSMMQDLRDAIDTREGGLNYMTKKEMMDSGKMPSAMTPEEKKLFTPEEMKKMMDEEAAAKKKTKSELEAEEKAAADAKFAAEQLEAEEAAAAIKFAAEKLAAEELEASRTEAEKYALLDATYTELKTKFEALEAENITLTEFKVTVEDAQKDALINTFFMLSDEDKAEVIENKAMYSLSDIESKLAVLCFKNKVSFAVVESNENEDLDDDGKPVVRFNLDSDAEVVPDSVKALRSARKK